MCVVGTNSLPEREEVLNFLLTCGLANVLDVDCAGRHFEGVL